MTEVELLDKTEVWIVGVALQEARLPDLAAVIADALCLPRDRVLVVDVRDDHIVLDVLQARVNLEAVAGKQGAVLEALRSVPGVALSSQASIHSYGVLGVIGAPSEQASEILDRTREVEAGVRKYVSHRVAVVSTGPEIVEGRVLDTNLEAVQEILGAAGFEVSSGGRVPDDERAIAGRVARLVSEGYGVVITTGGVGAEDKDHTIEALQLVDPELCTAELARYEIGMGRHVKPAVRIAIGRLQWTTLVALPGPTKEVRAALPTLLLGWSAGLAASELVELVASTLRMPFRQHAH